MNPSDNILNSLREQLGLTLSASMAKAKKIEINLSIITSYYITWETVIISFGS